MADQNITLAWVHAALKAALSADDDEKALASCHALLDALDADGNAMGAGGTSDRRASAPSDDERTLEGLKARARRRPEVDRHLAKVFRDVDLPPGDGVTFLASGGVRLSHLTRGPTRDARASSTVSLLQPIAEVRAGVTRPRR